MGIKRLVLYPTPDSRFARSGGHSADVGFYTSPTYQTVVAVFGFVQAQGRLPTQEEFDALNSSAAPKGGCFGVAFFMVAALPTYWVFERLIS